MHVGGLILITPPKGSGPEFMADIAARARAAAKAYEPFNQRLVKRMGLWFWDEDREFDIEAHVHHVALPKPGRIRELLALVSKLHSGLMDRAKPLWEMFLIEGVEDGRAAVYFKIHHSMADGIAGARMLQKAMSTDPKSPVMTPIWAMPPARRAKTLPVPLGVLPQFLAAAREQLTAVPKVATEVGRSIRARITDPDHVSVFQAPPSILNQRVSASRRFAAQSWSLSRIKAVARAHNVTLNDVVLAMCASALRQYLIDLRALPEKPLIAMVPVSLRKDDSDSGNQLALVLANLATDHSDAHERLEIIARSMQHSKKKFAAMSQLEIMEYVSTVMSIPSLNIATGMMPTRQPYNVIISNVPGPKEKLYFNGAEVGGMYPVSIVMDGQAINITMQSYADKLEFGLIACSRTLPSMQRLLQYLEDGLQELEPAASAAPVAPAVPAKAKKTKPAPKRTAAKTAPGGRRRPAVKGARK
jgi:diacylglycerol O-acyltransferase